MEHRASKHVARRNDVLVRAIMRIWKAHERGQLLTRVRAMRVLKLAWTQWRRRMEEQREREGHSSFVDLVFQVISNINSRARATVQDALHFSPMCFCAKALARGLPIAPECAVLRGPLQQATIAISDNVDLAPAAPCSHAQGKTGKNSSKVPPSPALLSYMDGQGRREAPREEAQGVPDAKG